MEAKALEIKLAIAAVFGFFTALWGWFGWLVVIWVASMATDWILGSWLGAKNNDWNSKRARDGIKGKGVMFFVVLVAGAVDLIIGMIEQQIPFIQLPFKYTVLLCPLVLVWYLVTELGSILENAVALGAPCPDFLKKILTILNSKINDAGKKIADAADSIGVNDGEEDKPGKPKE